MHKLSMWSLTLLQICFLIFKTSYRNKQCSVMLNEGHFTRSKERTRFSKTKGFLRILDGFFLKTKGFLPKVYEIF